MMRRIGGVLVLLFIVLPVVYIASEALRTQSLAFLWIRALLGRHWNLHTIRGEVDDPQLPPVPIDAVLIANTYHELTAPDSILKILFTSMRSGARLVVVDRAPRAGHESRAEAVTHHELTAADAEAEITRHGLQTMGREDRFIDRAGDQEIWWLIVFRRP